MNKGTYTAHSETELLPIDVSTSPVIIWTRHRYGA